MDEILNSPEFKRLSRDLAEAAANRAGRTIPTPAEERAGAVQAAELLGAADSAARVARMRQAAEEGTRGRARRANHSEAARRARAKYRASAKGKMKADAWQAQYNEARRLRRLLGDLV